MSGENWVRIDIYKPHGALDRQTHDQMKRTITALVNALEKAQQPGFQIGYWGRNERDGTMAAVTYWRDRASIEGAAGRLRQLSVDAGALGMTRVDSRNVHLYSIVRQEPDAPSGQQAVRGNRPSGVTGHQG